VLPILHLNGYKISNPLSLRVSPGKSWSNCWSIWLTPYFVEGDDPAIMHQAMAAVLDEVIGVISAIRQEALANGPIERPRWPMIVLKTPKGWTGPKEVDGLPVEGTFRRTRCPFRSCQKPGTPAAVGGLDEEL